MNQAISQTVKPLVLIYGDLHPTSTLRSQLGLQTVFNYMLSGTHYLSSPRTRFPELSKHARIEKATFFNSPITVADIKTALNRAATGAFDWQKASGIVLVPGSLYVAQSGEYDAFLTKLALSTEPWHVQGDGAVIIKLSPAQILGLPERTPIEEIEVSKHLPLPVRNTNLGHALGLWQASMAHSHPRQFNSLEVDLPYIKKRTVNIKKGESEYQFFLNTPAALRAYFPQVGRAQSNSGSFEYEIEFLPMLDLSKFLIHNTLGNTLVFEDVLTQLESFLDEAPRKSASREEVRHAFQRDFIDKLDARQRLLTDSPGFEALSRTSTAVIPGGLSHLVTSIRQSLVTESEKGSIGDEVVFSHGDLCPSNILYDRITRKLKLIDPRGGDSFRAHHYDLAKLSHSFLGGYDFIVNDLCVAHFDDQLFLQIEPPQASVESFQEVQRIFRSWLKKRNCSTRLIRLCESSLFVSMLPLHADNPRRQLYQLCAARNAYNAYLRGDE